MASQDFAMQVYENFWIGLTPLIMAGLFLLGLWTAKRFASVGASTLTVSLAYIFIPVLLALSLPVFITARKG